MSHTDFNHSIVETFCAHCQRENRQRLIFILLSCVFDVCLSKVMMVVKTKL